MALFSVAVVLFCYNTDNPDYAKYKFQFDTMEAVSLESGGLFFLIGRLLRIFGVEYGLFVTAISVTGLCFISSFIQRYSSRISYVFALYLIYPFLLDVVQIRNFFAYSIVLLSIHHLEAPTPSSVAKYAASVLLASGVHIAALAYLLLLIVTIKSQKLFIFSVCIIAALGVLLARVISLIPLSGSLGDLGWRLEYYKAGSTIRGAVRYALLIAGTLIFVCLNNAQRAIRPLVASPNWFLFRLAMVVIVFTPLVAVSGEFVRLIRNTWPIYYILLSNKSERHSTYQYLPVIVALLLAMFLFIKELGPTAFYFENVTKRVLENNSFFSLFKQLL